MGQVDESGSDWAKTNARYSGRVLKWTIAWVVSTACAAFGPKAIWDFAVIPTILGVLVNMAIGFGMIVAVKQHLHAMDEMQQKIFLDAGAITLGVGLVCGLSYELLEDIKLIAYEPEISHLIILMCLTFVVAMITGHRRYQ